MSGDNAPTFRETVKRLRKDRKLSQALLAAAAGVSRQTIRDWETKENVSPRHAHLKRAARALGVPISELHAAIEHETRQDGGLLLPRQVWRVVVDDYLQSELGKDVKPRLREQLYRIQSRTFARNLVHAIRQDIEGRLSGRRR
jgi:transcriptional regulator with XRE-family HTH domain